MNCGYNSLLMRYLEAATATTATTTIDSIAVIAFSFALYPYMCVSHGMRLVPYRQTRNGYSYTTGQCVCCFHLMHARHMGHPNATQRPRTSENRVLFCYFHHIQNFLETGLQTVQASSANRLHDVNCCRSTHARRQHANLWWGLAATLVV